MCIRDSCNPEVMLDPAYAAGWNGLLNIINSAPTIDPVHAAGGCYCWECIYHASTEGGRDYCALHESVCSEFCGDGKIEEAQDATD